MNLLRPEALFWALLAVPLVVLYWRGDRIPRQVVAVGSLWHEVLVDRAFRTRWLSWRRPVSLAIHLVVLCAMVLAIAEPEWWPYLAVGALGLLVVEWRLFQRRWTC